jgi:hypothetical protein
MVYLKIIYTNIPSYVNEQAKIQKKEIERRLRSFRGESSKGKDMDIGHCNYTAKELYFSYTNLY